MDVTIVIRIIPQGADGTREWFINGRPHRDAGDQPARIYPSGEKEWYKSGLLHRDNDLPAREEEGLQEWFVNGKLHRDGDKPARIAGDVQEWFVNGKLIKPLYDEQ